jgi:hypothetical protein
MNSPSLDHKVNRRFAYPAVFYEEVRSGYVHEYRIGAKADPWVAAATDDFEISYGNWLNDPDRHIHFPVIWIGKVAESMMLASSSPSPITTSLLSSISFSNRTMSTLPKVPSKR